MRSVSLLVVGGIFAFLASHATRAAESAVRILDATYGRPAPDQSRDVRRILDQYARTEKYTIRINPTSMQGDPNPGRKNTLTIEYEVSGKIVKTSVKDGELFVFQGVGAVPTRALTTAGRAALRIENKFPHSIYAYHIHPWGSWEWGAEIERGGSFSTTAGLDSDWVITSTRNANILYRFKTQPGKARVVVSP